MSPARIPPVEPAPGEDAQSSETSSEPLEWQNELDVAIADIDSRLRHPRRRATDVHPAATRPGAMTTEVIDEIAWRVAELLRGDGGPPVKATDVAAAISKTLITPGQRAAISRPPAPPASPTESKQLAHGIVLTLRIRKPFFQLPWPFRRRKRQRMIMFSDSRIN